MQHHADLWLGMEQDQLEVPQPALNAQLPPLAVGAGEEPWPLSPWKLEGVQVLAEHQLSPPEGQLGEATHTLLSL